MVTWPRGECCLASGALRMMALSGDAGGVCWSGKKFLCCCYCSRLEWRRGSSCCGWFDQERRSCWYSVHYCSCGLALFVAVGCYWKEMWRLWATHSGTKQEKEVVFHLWLKELLLLLFTVEMEERMQIFCWCSL